MKTDLVTEVLMTGLKKCDYPARRLRLVWLFFWHIFLMGLLAPYLAMAFIVAAGYLEDGINVFVALFYGLWAAALAIFVFTYGLILLPFIVFALLHYLLCRVIMRWLPSGYWLVCVLTAWGWGIFAGWFLAPSLAEFFEVGEFVPVVVGAVVGVVCGLLLALGWRRVGDVTC